MFVGCAPAILRPSGLLSALRPQDVFATSLYTGANATQRTVTGINMLDAGGLVWHKSRSAGDHILFDTLVGPTRYRSSNTTAADQTTSAITFYNDGFGDYASSGGNAAWSFRRAPKFFDIVTYTGDGTSGRVIPHALGIKPGMIIVKRRDAGNNWRVWHVGTGNAILYLDGTQAASADNGLAWGNGSTHVPPTDTGFTVSGIAGMNASGGTYVAYLFAHDPDTTNGIVQCGSFTPNGSGAATVNLGWPAQYAIIKSSSGADNWGIYDTSRGWFGSDRLLLANLSDAESGGSYGQSTSTGFTIANFGAGATYIYLAIRAPIT